MHAAPGRRDDASRSGRPTAKGPPAAASRPATTPLGTRAAYGLVACRRSRSGPAWRSPRSSVSLSTGGFRPLRAAPSPTRPARSPASSVRSSTSLTATAASPDLVKTEAAAAQPSPLRAVGDETPRGVGTASSPPAASIPPSTPSAASPEPDERPSAAPRERNRTQAVAVAPSGPREQAEQARSRMTAAKQAAERVAAAFYARNRFASAQTKERDGMAALGKSDYATAAGLFSAAQSDYQTAMAEAAAGRGKGAPARPAEGQPRSGARGGRGTSSAGAGRGGGSAREGCVRPGAGQAGRGRRTGRPQGSCRGRAGVPGRVGALRGSRQPRASRAPCQVRPRRAAVSSAPGSARTPARSRRDALAGARRGAD